MSGRWRGPPFPAWTPVACPTSMRHAQTAPDPAWGWGMAAAASVFASGPGMRAQAGKAPRGNTLLAAARGGIRVRGLPPKWQMC